jgi:glycosyltransferase involved in cell wall biosynthesis
MNSERFAVIIPVYNHEGRAGGVVRTARALGYPVYVIDDGSTDSTYEKIRDIPGVTILRHEYNRGKGAALKTAFAAAGKVADWAITMDADGQHDPANAAELVETLRSARATGARPIIIGMRRGMAAGDVPWTSRFGRKFSNFWVRACGGPKVRDSQSGFRIYPLPEVLSLNVKADRFQFEVEALVKANWRGMPVLEAPVSVTYTPGTGRISHFRPFVDFLRNSGTFMRLLLQRILIPWRLRKRF